MEIELKLSTTLREYVPEYDPHKVFISNLADGSTIFDLVKKLEVPLEELKIIMLNGKHANLDAILTDKDRVALFPAVGGG